MKEKTLSAERRRRTILTVVLSVTRKREVQQ